ncbi:MAG: ferritin [Anaerolineaceae bacterium]|nr:ferritin [Anaerolineaceae bacterium]
MTTMISQELNDAINAQIGREFGASLQYMQIASFFDGLALSQAAKLFFEQAQEEHDHAMKFLKYILDAGGEVHIPPIDAPKSSFVSAEEVVSLALKWEEDVTGYINNLMEIALRQKDYIARQFLDWFENEQLEEVSKMDKLLRVVKGVGERNLYMIEAYLSHLD